MSGVNRAWKSEGCGLMWKLCGEKCIIGACDPNNNSHYTLIIVLLNMKNVIDTFLFYFPGLSSIWH